VKKKKSFISYAHEDASFAQKLAESLNASGVDLFFDKWDIHPGASIVKKIFDEGLGDCELFLIVLSPASVDSSWVRNELDVATVQRIEGLTRIVPILKADCQIPMSLRPLRWLDMRSDFEGGIRELTKLAYGVNDRPPLGTTPTFITELHGSVGGLSREATGVGTLLLNESDIDGGRVPQIRGNEISASTKLSAIEVNDAVDELEEFGLVKTLKWLGTGPYDFGAVMPRYLLFLHFKEALPYDPDNDVRIAVNAIAALNLCDANTLSSHSGLSAGRLNRAIEYIDDYGIAEVQRYMGTAPYTFGKVRSTRRTREASKAAV
jgi:hypothetical protein